MSPDFGDVRSFPRAPGYAAFGRETHLNGIVHLEPYANGLSGMAALGESRKLLGKTIAIGTPRQSAFSHCCVHRDGTMRFARKFGFIPEEKAVRGLPRTARRRLPNLNQIS